MDSFMVVCTFAPGTDMGEVMAVVAEEQAQVAALEAEGRIGSIELSLARGTVFIKVFAEGAEAAADTVRSLPMSKWWDLDIFPINAPVARGLAADPS